MACFGFSKDTSCQYDPHHLIPKRRKKQKRGNYKHQGTQEMELMDNKLTIPSDQEKQSELMNLVITPSVPTDAKGKNKIWTRSIDNQYHQPIFQKARVIQRFIFTSTRVSNSNYRINKGKRSGYLKIYTGTLQFFEGSSQSGKVAN